MKAHRIVEMEHGTAEAPPRYNLNVLAMMADGMPTTGPPNMDPIRIVIVLTFAGASPKNIEIEERIPRIEKTTAHQNRLLLDLSPPIIALNVLRRIDIIMKIKEIASILNMSKNEPRPIYSLITEL